MNWLLLKLLKREVNICNKEIKYHDLHDDVIISSAFKNKKKALKTTIFYIKDN